MPLVDQLDEAAAVDMRVNFGRRDVGVAEHQLQRAQIGAAFEQVRRKGVAQHMRADRGRVDPGARGELAQHLEQSHARDMRRSEEHTSELQSLMRISYAVFCLKKKTHNDE